MTPPTSNTMMRGSVASMAARSEPRPFAVQRRHADDAPAAAARRRGGPADRAREGEPGPAGGLCERRVDEPERGRERGEDGKPLCTCRCEVGRHAGPLEAVFLGPQPCVAGADEAQYIANDTGFPYPEIASQQRRPKGTECSITPAAARSAQSPSRARGSSSPHARRAGRSRRFPARCPRISRPRTPCRMPAIGLWPDTIAGWKVGLVGRDQVAALQAGPPRGADLQPQRARGEARPVDAVPGLLGWIRGRRGRVPVAPRARCAARQARMDTRRSRGARRRRARRRGNRRQPARDDQRHRAACDRRGLRQQRRAHRRPRAAAAGARGRSRTGSPSRSSAARASGAAMAPSCRAGRSSRCAFCSR